MFDPFGWRRRKKEADEAYAAYKEEMKMLTWGMADAMAAEIGDRVERCHNCDQLYRVSDGCDCGVRVVDAQVRGLLGG